jgi:hypothetical protein
MTKDLAFTDRESKEMYILQGKTRGIQIIIDELTQKSGE